jgi:integrase
VKTTKGNLIRATFPKVRRYTKDGKDYYHILARSKKLGINEHATRASKKEALEYAEEIANRVALGESMTKDEQRLFMHYREQFKKFSADIERVLAEKLARLQTNEDYGEQKVVLTSVAIDEYEKEKLGKKFNDYRNATLKEVKGTAKAIRENWGNLPLFRVKESAIERFIETRKAKNGGPPTKVTKRNWKVRISAFFNWCISKKYCEANPTARLLYKSRPGDVQIIAIEDVRLLLKTAEENERYRGIINYLAIGFFAGIRPDELRRLQWKDIRIQGQQPTIFVPSAIAKVGPSRSVAIYDTLHRFLTKYQSEPIRGPNFNKLFDELRMKAGYALKGQPGKKWVPDGMRHTFASMHVAKYGNEEELATLMGNSVEVIRGHYKKTIDPLIAEEFWKITPIEKSVDGAEPAETIGPASIPEENRRESKQINGNSPVQDVQGKEGVE